MEIKVGDYVRTDNGIIGKYVKYRGIEDSIENNHRWIGFDIEKDIVKHSKNIIDLIEVGDIVHTRDVLNEDYYYMFDDEMIQATRETIESGIKLLEILTHEQFEQNCYRLEESNG